MVVSVEINRLTKCPMQAILQASLPYDISRQRLPGVRGCKIEEWLSVDDAFSAQMALRENLIETKRDQVIALTPTGEPAAHELLAYLLDWIEAYGRGYRVENACIRRPDGVTVAIDRSDPLGTVGRLVQEDICLLEKVGDVHVMTAAVVCFPASWRLAEKIGRPLTDIHMPVPQYDATLARRVQKLFDAVQLDQPIWRYNALNYADPSLFQPYKRSGEGIVQPGPDMRRYLRSERQTILRLPETNACVFSIHSFVLDRLADGFADVVGDYSVPEMSRSIE